MCAQGCLYGVICQTLEWSDSFPSWETYLTDVSVWTSAQAWCGGEWGWVGVTVRTTTVQAELVWVSGESSSFVLIRKFLLPGSCMALAGDSLFFFPPSLFKRTTNEVNTEGGKRDTSRQMSSIESHHTCFCDIRGSFLHSPLLNPDKRFALNLFALLMSKSNIIHFTFYFWTIVGDGCRPRWANTDVWTAFDSKVQNSQDALILLFVAGVVIMMVMIYTPRGSLSVGVHIWGALLLLFPPVILFFISIGH